MANNSELTKNRILDSASKFFGSLGYELTSTNQIFLDANISKGLIFKHFKSKALLFYAVFARELELMVSGVEKELNLTNMDPLDKIVAITMWKISYANAHPEVTKILLEAITHPPEEVRKLIEKDLVKLSAFSIERFFAEIDRSRIRPEISRDDFIRLIQISLLGLQNYYVKDKPSFIYQEDVQKQCIDYMKIVLRGMER